jgi:hypothetical protein
MRIRRFFEIFYGFLHSGQIFSTLDGDAFQDEDGDECDAEWSRLSDCWAIGERLLAVSFKDIVVDALVNKREEDQTTPLGMHTDIYPKSRTQSGICKFLVDIAVEFWDTEDFVFEPETAQFFFDVAVACKEGDHTFHTESCHYHEHIAEGNPCYKTMF